LFENSLKPKKIILHENDTKILALDRSDKSKLYYLDLEKEKIITDFVI